MIQTINVYYGGTYEEHWTPEQRLYISRCLRPIFRQCVRSRKRCRPARSWVSMPVV